MIHNMQTFELLKIKVKFSKTFSLKPKKKKIPQIACQLHLSEKCFLFFFFEASILCQPTLLEKSVFHAV